MYILTTLKCCYKPATINIIRKYSYAGSCSITKFNDTYYGSPLALNCDNFMNRNRLCYGHRKNGISYNSSITTNQFRYLNSFNFRNISDKSETSTQQNLNHTESSSNAKFAASKTIISTETTPSRKNCEKLNVNLILNDGDEKIGLFARFKLMYKKYWYVLIPVHVITSIGWLGGFYYMSKSGVDIASILDYLHISDAIMDKIKQSNMGHYAVAYLCYKISTPLRYAVTLGGTTVSIKYLVQHGYIRPVPTKKELMRMYEDNKAIRAKRKRD